MDMNDPCLQVDGPCTMRLHVGGLGPSIISSDLVQIFSNFAKVSCVDLVHTKGRNFAYVTIQAASKDIKRLFSLYNGCMWKGGRLKLEKAREFYLDKLHREWTDRDCLQATQVPKPECSTTGRSLMKSKESTGFNVYIPRLRKVKTIPEKGLGKHKRSFERVDPLPYSLLQVCNCDPHCTTTSNSQSRTRKKPWGLAREEVLQDIITFCSEKTKESIEGVVFAAANKQTQACGTEAQEVGEGVQRKQVKDTWASNEKKHLGEKRKLADLRLKGGETNESKACEKSSSRSWVQKASWKTLVGETGRMSFSLGSMLVGTPESPKVRAKFETHASIPDQDRGERIAQTSEGSRPWSTKGNGIKQMVEKEKLLSPSGHDRGSTFMKSSASEQDWLESKQAVQRIVKRFHKDAMKTRKGLHMKQRRER